MYTPALIWRFVAAPLLQSDLGFIMEELDRCYNGAVTLAKRLATSGLLTSDRYGPRLRIRSRPGPAPVCEPSLLSSVCAAS